MRKSYMLLWVLNTSNSNLSISKYCLNGCWNKLMELISLQYSALLNLIIKCLYTLKWLLINIESKDA